MGSIPMALWRALWSCQASRAISAECTPWRRSCCIDPDFAATGEWAVAFTRMDSAQGHFVKLHTDMNDRDVQYLLAFGPFSGGALVCHGPAAGTSPDSLLGWEHFSPADLQREILARFKDPTAAGARSVEMAYRGKVLRADGRLPHRVADFHGTRYTAIFYMPRNPNQSHGRAPTPLFWPPQFV